MVIIDEYRRLTEEIAVTESRITSAERELKKLSATYAPRGIGSLDYSAERVSGGKGAPSMDEMFRKMMDLNTELVNDREELQSLHWQRDKLSEVIDALGCQQKKVLMYRISGLSNARIAQRLGCSKRHVERLISETRQKVEK